MAHGIKLACAATALTMLLFIGSGCTSMLYENNLEYARQSREFQRVNQRLSGTYLGMETYKGTLCEIYQFESPFQNGNDGSRLDVLIPVYGVSEKAPIRIHENDERLAGEEPAELWFWDGKESAKVFQGQCPSKRRVDMVWLGDGSCAVTRRIPNGDKVTTDKWLAELVVPWNKRSRTAYFFRHCAYAGTVSADIVAGAGVVVAGAGYVTLLACIYCPCAVEVLVHALD